MMLHFVTGVEALQLRHQEQLPGTRSNELLGFWPILRIFCASKANSGCLQKMSIFEQ
jgi:hypothetical protein